MNCKGIAKGKTIELEEVLPYPEGQPVSVSVEPLEAQLRPDSSLTGSGKEAPSFFEAKIDLEALAAQQEVPMISNFDKLIGNFWPEDESADQFIAMVRTWRHES
jgi:hypothetical protein